MSAVCEALAHVLTHVFKKPFGPSYNSTAPGTTVKPLILYLQTEDRPFDWTIVSTINHSAVEDLKRPFIFYDIN